MVKHLRLAQCDSTQDELKRQLDRYDLVSTEQQNAGRGRGDHSWDHLTGALAFSFVAPAHPQLTWQALEVAVSLAMSFEELWGVTLDLKWPNDLYREGKKCGGILLQYQAPRMLIGVGINLHPDSSASWGSVWNHQKKLDSDWAHQMPSEFVERYLANCSQSAELIHHQWLKRCVHLNRKVTITDGNEIVEGIFSGLGAHGEAIVSDKSVFNGSLRWID